MLVFIMYLLILSVDIYAWGASGEIHHHDALTHMSSGHQHLDHPAIDSWSCIRIKVSSYTRYTSGNISTVTDHYLYRQATKAAGSDRVCIFHSWVHIAEGLWYRCLRAVLFFCMRFKSVLPEKEWISRLNLRPIAPHQAVCSSSCRCFFLLCLDSDFGESQEWKAIAL